MALPADINPRIVDALYCDALVLADELRTRFGGDFSIGEDCAARVALSCEGLRATTRTMHCLAWLLNHRDAIHPLRRTIGRSREVQAMMSGIR